MAIIPPGVQEIGRYVAWVPPPNDCWKLNFATFAIIDGSPGGIAGIIRDKNGIFKFAIAEPIEHWTQELRLSALLIGLRLAVYYGIIYLVIEGDDETVCEMVNAKDKPKDYRMWPMYDECCELLCQFKDMSVTYVPYNMNRAAKTLAVKAVELEKGETWVDTPPFNLDAIFCEDVIGYYIYNAVKPNE